MVERQVPRWSELRELARPRRISGDATARRLARAATVGDLREIARRRVPRAVFDYADGAAGAEISLRRSREAFERVEFCPSVLRNVADGGPVHDGARRPVVAAPGLRADRVHPAHAHRGRGRGGPGVRAHRHPVRAVHHGHDLRRGAGGRGAGGPAVVPALPVAGPGGQRRPGRACPGGRLRGAGAHRGHPGRRAAAARRPQRLHDPAGPDPADDGQRRAASAVVGRPADHSAPGVRVAPVLGRHGGRTRRPGLRAGRLRSPTCGRCGSRGRVPWW